MHIRVFRKGRQSICIRDAELAGDLRCGHPGIPEGIDDHEIGELGIMFVLVEKKELIGDDVPAHRISALPAALMHDQNQLKIILHDGVIDGPGIDAFGVHAV